LLADVFEGEIEAARHILANPCRDADPAGRGQAFEARRDIHAVTEDVIVLDDDVSLVDADAERDAAVGWKRRITVRQCRLQFGRATESVDDAGELDQQPVAGGLDEAALVIADLWIDHLGAQRLEPGERAFLVSLDQPRIAREIGGEDRRQPAFDATPP
jgi:hypothetical protein